MKVTRHTYTVSGRFISLESVEKSSRYVDRPGGGTGEGECFLCGRKIRSFPRCSWVHYTTGGYITSLDEEGMKKKDPGGRCGVSQGFFPIGPDCARRIPARFVFPGIQKIEEGGAQ